MSFTTASYHSMESSTLEMYLRDPPMLFKRFTNGHDMGSLPGCFSNVSADIFQARLATALNTFIMATYNTTVLTGGDGTSTENRNAMWKSTTAEWIEFTDRIYVLHKAWFSLYMTSTAVLLSCAAVNIVIRCLIRAPDFLDGVAGLTRDSSFIDVPQEGSGMSGSDRLQMIKGVRVRICDVKPDEAVGRIALTTGVDSTKLDWRRLYS